MYNHTVDLGFRSHTKYAYYLHTVSLWQATAGPETGQESVLQVDDCLADFFISAQQVKIIHSDLQVFVLRQEAGQLKRPGQKWKRSYIVFVCFLFNVSIQI